MGELKKELFDRFGGFADKRIINLDQGNIFAIDDREKSDFGSNRQLYGSFCQILATVIDDDTVKIDMRGNVPDSDRVRGEIEKFGGQFTESGASFVIGRGQQQGLFGLSRAFTAIIRKPYTERSYKFVCPRTSNSLRRLLQALNKVWQERV